jgi:hypothetical protein
MISAAAGPARAVEHIRFAVPDKALLVLSVRDSYGQPVDDAALMQGPVTLARSDRCGRLQAEIDGGEWRLELAGRGYTPLTLTIKAAAGSMTTRNVVLPPIDGGVFFNRTVMLDPENASAVTLLERLKDKIEHAGGRALITWQTGPAPPCRERIMQAADVNADVFLNVRAAGRRYTAGHYHRSAAGLDLAQQLRKSFANQDLTGFRKCTVLHSTHETVLHTPMPAVELTVPLQATRKKTDAITRALYDALRQWLQNNGGHAG